MLKITRLEKGYSIPQLKMERVSINQIGNIIREKGCDVEVKTHEGIDMTKETLFRVAFDTVIPPSFAEEKINYLCEVIKLEDLMFVIENGNIVNYVNRKMRGALNEQRN